MGLAVLGCILVMFAGCSSQDFARPTGSSISDIMDTGNPYIKDTSAQEALERSKLFAKALAEWQLESPEEKPTYHLGPDDSIKLEILSFEEPGKPSVLIRTISPENEVNLSWAGKVKLGGLTIQEAEEAVRTHLANGYIHDPKVTISVAEYKSAGVVLTGAVSKPGVYYLKRDRRTLLEVLAQADGLDVNSGDELMLIRGKQSMESTDVNVGATNSLITVDLRQLVDSGDLRMNLWVQRGDIITVLPRKNTYISVLGYVNRPGSFDIAGKGDIDALKAVAMAGGLTSSARAQNSWLLRSTKDGQKMVPIDLTKIAHGKKPPIILASGDTLVIGSSMIAKLSEFIKVGGSVGASYSPVP
ncbi:hypothetical protein BVX97_04315 [bacterium E08(2017)]|nr:hypothetical protein BVX97_04315 [bacterium E08(2017)]